MGDNGCPQANAGMVPYKNGIRMIFINIDILADPYVVPNLHTAQSMKKRTNRTAARYDHGNLM
jgi:hypothetical protein